MIRIGQVVQEVDHVRGDKRVCTRLMIFGVGVVSLEGAEFNPIT